MKPLVRSVALLAGALALSPATQEPEQRILALARLDESPVGAFRRPVEAWGEPSARSRELLEPGGRSQETSAQLGGIPHAFVLLWSDDAEAPDELAWYPLDGDAASSRAPLALRSLGGELKQARVELPGDGPLALELFLQGGQLAGAGSWTGGAVWEGRFELAGEMHLVWLLDGDCDGRLGGADDRWIAGPAAILQELTLANPRQELRPCGVPWALGEVALALVESEGATARLEVGAPVDREELRAAHYRRVQEEFAAVLPARRLMLEKQGEEPDRPVVDSPVPWRFVRSLDEARALAGDGPMLLELTSFSCSWCRLLSHLTHPDEEVDALLRPLARAKLVAELDPARTHRLFDAGSPTTLLLAPDGRELGRIRGFQPPSRFAASLRALLENAPAPREER